MRLAATLGEPYALGVLAEGCSILGRIARREVAEALAIGERTGAGMYSADLLRLDAELLAASSASNGAEARFGEALETARRQGAKAWELRAALGLASYLSRRGQERRARELVAAVYGGFTEGFDSPDLVEAKRLLE
jgi:predicted ATPase